MVYRSKYNPVIRRKGKKMITNDKGIVELKHLVLREICRLQAER